MLSAIVLEQAEAKTNAAANTKDLFIVRFLCKRMGGKHVAQNDPSTPPISSARLIP